MPYLIDQINIIANKKIYLLLDRYSLLDKNKKIFQTVKISDTTALYVPQETLMAIKNQNNDTPCYGLWQLLYHHKKINFDADIGLFVLYSNQKKDTGFFLYYHKDNKDYHTGLIIKGKMIGLFGSTLPEATVIEIAEEALVENLPNEILRPLDRYKKEQSLMRTVFIYAISAISFVAITLFVALSIIIPYENKIIFSVQVQEKKKIQSLNNKIKQKKLALSKLKLSKVNTNTNKENISLLLPLSILAKLNVNFTLSAKISDTKGRLTFKKAQPWMSQLPKEIFTISQENNNIYIDWEIKK